MTRCFRRSDADCTASTPSASSSEAMPLRATCACWSSLRSTGVRHVTIVRWMPPSGQAMQRWCPTHSARRPWSTTTPLTCGPTPSRPAMTTSTISICWPRRDRLPTTLADSRRAVAVARQAMTELTDDADPARRSKLGLSLARALWISGDWSASLEAYEETLAAAPPAPHLARIRALAGLGQAYMLFGWLGRFPTAV